MTTAFQCPHCARDLEDPTELATGLCTSDDCPRHDIARLTDTVDKLLGYFAKRDDVSPELDQLLLALSVDTWNVGQGQPRTPAPLAQVSAQEGAPLLHSLLDMAEEATRLREASDDEYDHATARAWRQDIKAAEALLTRLT